MLKTENTQSWLAMENSTFLEDPGQAWRLGKGSETQNECSSVPRALLDLRAPWHQLLSRFTNLNNKILSVFCMSGLAANI